MCPSCAFQHAELIASPVNPYKPDASPAHPTAFMSPESCQDLQPPRRTQECSKAPIATGLLYGQLSYKPLDMHASQWKGRSRPASVPA